MSEATHAYLGLKQCGCVAYLVVDDPRWKKDVAKGIAECLRDGLTIERHQLGTFGDLLKKSCTHAKVSA